jgi:UDP-N-acetylenolpyruvoylglucosamine reductase
VIADLGATSKEIRAFGDMLSKKVFDVTSIMLEPEVEFVGTF